MPATSALFLVPILLSLPARGDPPGEITAACQPGGGVFAAFPGEYSMRLRIGAREFLDELSIRRVTRRPGTGAGAEKFHGEFRSPGLFTVPVRDGDLRLNASSPPLVELGFHIEVQEGGGDTYGVDFLGTAPLDTGACLLRGEARLTGSGRRLGSFLLRKNTMDCLCSIL